MHRGGTGSSTTSLREAADRDEFLAALYRGASALLVSPVVYSVHGEELREQLEPGAPPRELTTLRLARGTPGIVSQVIEHRIMYVGPPSDDIARRLVADVSVDSSVALLPIVVRGRTVCIACGTIERPDDATLQLSLETFANIAAVSLEQVLVRAREHAIHVPASESEWLGVLTGARSKDELFHAVLTAASHVLTHVALLDVRRDEVRARLWTDDAGAPRKPPDGRVGRSEASLASRIARTRSVHIGAIPADDPIWGLLATPPDPREPIALVPVVARRRVILVIAGRLRPGALRKQRRQLTWLAVAVADAVAALIVRLKGRRRSDDTLVVELERPTVPERDAPISRTGEEAGTWMLVAALLIAAVLVGSAVLQKSSGTLAAWQRDVEAAIAGLVDRVRSR